MAQAEKPLGIALILCDRVITDSKTQEKTLVATIGRISTKRFPCVHPRMSIFVAATNGRGPVTTQIRCVNESENSERVFEVKGKINFPNPIHVVEMSFQLNNITFQKPGLHSVEFMCDDEMILQSRFQVMLLEEKKRE